MAWLTVPQGRGVWAVADTDRPLDARLVANGMSWEDAEALCRFHGSHPGEFDIALSDVHALEPF